MVPLPDNADLITKAANWKEVFKDAFARPESVGSPFARSDLSAYALGLPGRSRRPTDAGQRREHRPLIAIGDTIGLTSYCSQRESNPLSSSLISRCITSRFFSIRQA